MWHSGQEGKRDVLGQASMEVLGILMGLRRIISPRIKKSGLIAAICPKLLHT
ncbi:protein of unknown function [Methylocaldum szegediense]|uniref:Uncharacterized protein n=1 Tax=Methylocaldum szegediense TaxID=73780 RepID=A0ABN8X4C8_9GAMM|nr:protein of unknown function [Methylocaldum szegediense]